MMSLVIKKWVNYTQNALFIEECPSKRKMEKSCLKQRKSSHGNNKAESHLPALFLSKEYLQVLSRENLIQDKSQVSVRFLHTHKLTFSKTGHNPQVPQLFKNHKKIPESLITGFITSETSFPFNLTLTQLKEGTQGPGAPRQRVRKSHALCHCPTSCC